MEFTAYSSRWKTEAIYESENSAFWKMGGKKRMADVLEKSGMPSAVFCLESRSSPVRVVEKSEAHKVHVDAYKVALFQCGLIG